MTKVLVVEDDLDLAFMLRTLLELDQHSVDLCHHGDEGLQMVLTRPYDLVILDWDLPGVNGLEILHQFRQRGSRTPVIMLTGRDSVENKEAGLDGGADDYLTKPFNMKELGARVKAHLRRSSAGAADNINLAGIDLDRANCRAAKSGRIYALSAKEFQLLEFAAKYPHIQPNCQDLLAQAWPPGNEKSEEGLEQTIRKLRKKFAPDAAFIYTHLFRDAPPEPESNPFVIGPLQTVTDDDPLVGTIFNGKYELVELIGGGASGHVYRGKHLVLGSSVALKILHLNTLSHPETLPRFSREARANAQLSHANIVSVRDFGLSEQSQPYLVMELLEGASLTEVLFENGPPPLLETINIFRQVCAGLDHAHEKGLVHRDIKPGNIMLINDGGAGVIVKIVDFGLARGANLDHSVAQITEPGIVLGSPPYMSPEQCRGEDLDKRSDIYSVGCALFEALQGQPPFCGKNLVDILVKHIRVEAAEIVFDNAPPLVQIKLNKVVAKCLAKEPEKRFQSALELKTALEDVLSELTATEPQRESLPLELPEQSSWSDRKTNVLNWLGRRLKRDPV